MKYDDITIGSFACEFGDGTMKPREIVGFDDLWESVSQADFDTMGCGTFRKMSGPTSEYLSRCIGKSLALADVPPDDIDYVIFAASEATVVSLEPTVVAECLDGAGLVRAIPVLIGFQQCCSSVSALSHGHSMVAAAGAENVIVVAFDFTANDSDRVKSFALFGDAAASCLISRTRSGQFRLTSSAVNVDYAGLQGNDSFVSRQQVAAKTLATVMTDELNVTDVVRVFATNLYRPITVFNAALAGLEQDKLHFLETLHRYGHCGNCDWMLNLVDFTAGAEIRSGQRYLLQSSAPGFFAAGILTAR